MIHAANGSSTGTTFRRMARQIPIERTLRPAVALLAQLGENPAADQFLREHRLDVVLKRLQLSVGTSRAQPGLWRGVGSRRYRRTVLRDRRSSQAMRLTPMPRFLSERTVI
jgi:hypothetical protein